MLLFIQVYFAKPDLHSSTYKRPQQLFIQTHFRKIMFCSFIIVFKLTFIFVIKNAVNRNYDF